jgi:Contractile injection system tube protein
VVTGYSQTPRLLKGALVRLGEPFLGPVPNVIVFQYNPETLTRELTPWTPPTEAEGTEPPTSGTAQPFDPGETVTLALQLDAADALEEPDTHPVAVLAGVADRIAALEQLLYPVGETLLGGLFSLGVSTAVPRGSVPIVLFIWGPGRIVPVRLTTFSVEEQQFSPTLYPIRATVSVGLRILTSDSFKAVDRAPSASERIAMAAYDYTRGQREILARANVANTAESILGMLPV